MNQDREPTTCRQDQSDAITHAHEYLDLVVSASDYLALDQALLLAQGYFETLLQCGLIQMEAFHTLNREALTLADAWRPPKQL